MGQDYEPGQNFTNEQSTGTDAEPAQAPHRGGQQHYRLLLENDLNRVYTGTLAALAAAEMAYVLGEAVVHLKTRQHGRAQLIDFDSELPPEDLAKALGQLSSSLMLLSADAPIALSENLAYGTDLVTTQRYKGKTNERLTRAMLNIALATAGVSLADCAHLSTDDRPVVLDPMCGRGTTLNWALAYGCDAVGIEPDATALRHYDTFITTWAKRGRVPHQRTSFRAGNAEQRHLTIELAPNRKAQKAGESHRLQTFAADGGDTSLAIKRSSVDVIVSDLPYGIQHSGKPPTGSAKRNPTNAAKLVANVAPAWKRWVRPGGAVCLAWNTKRTSRDDLSQALTDAGFEVLPEPDPFSMAHTVDANIDREVVVARA